MVESGNTNLPVPVEAPLRNKSNKALASVITLEPPAEEVIERDVSLFSQREEAISQIQKFFKRKGWHQTTCENWLLKVTGYRTPEECPDEKLAMALRNIEAQMPLA